MSTKVNNLRSELAPRTSKDRLIVALDVPDASSALALAGSLANDVGMLKIGLELFVAEGPDIVRQIRSAFPQLDIFLDLKLHDIPNTMKGAIRSAGSLGVRFLTVHAGSGTEHLRACAQQAHEASDGQLGILAVTVLTSQDAQACREAGHTREPAELVAMRAACAREAGCAGIVCSGRELPQVCEVAPELFKVVPGIRPAGAAVGDQRRVMTPQDAVAAGASHIVVGRPITQADDPARAASSIVASLNPSA